MKKGFTLAEVLITLGIIGVVAAMTIPTLIANIRSKQFASGYKKTISTLNQAVRMNKAQYDWDFAAAQGSAYNPKCEDANPENDFNFCAIINGNLKGITYSPYDIFPSETDATKLVTPEVEGDKAFYSIKIPFNMGSSNLVDARTVYSLNDGTVIMLPTLPEKGDCNLPIGTKLNDALSANIDIDEEGGHIYYACVGYIDVNGPSLPNTEIKCSTGTTSQDLEEPCIVKNKDVTDVYPVVFYDSTVAPASNAAKYVFDNFK